MTQPVPDPPAIMRGVIRGPVLHRDDNFTVDVVRAVPHHPPTVDITRCAVNEANLLIQYRVSPVPELLVGDVGRSEGDDAGVAFDSRRRIYTASRSAYRVSADGSVVTGALRLGPAVWPTLGVLRILFAPLAHTPGLQGLLCEACLTVDASRIRTTSVRCR